MSEISKLRATLKPLGVDGDRLISEIAAAVNKGRPPQPTLDVQEIVNEVERRVATKLDPLLAMLKDTQGAVVDPKAIVSSVVEVLGPKILEASESVYQREKQALVGAISANIRAEQENQLAVREEQRENQDGQREQGGKGLMVSSLLRDLLANSDSIAQLVGVFRGSKGTNEAIAEQTLRYFRFHQTLSKMEGGKLSAEELYKELSGIGAPVAKG